jgi:hypothetical protein
MDPDIVRGMIGRGFRLGLYGHQHRTQITPEHVYLPNRETMAVASAGSLCAGWGELPTGARRGYSLIEIGEQYDSARIHVREMAFANLFSRANLAIFGGRSYVDLTWTTPVDAGGRPEDPVREKFANVLREAEEALRQRNNPREALDLLKASNANDDQFGRRLMVAAAEQLANPDELIAVIGRPRTIEELVLCTDAHLQKEDWQAAAAGLKDQSEELEIPSTIEADLLARIDLMRAIAS